MSHRLVDQRKGLCGHSFVLLVHVAVIRYAEVSLCDTSATKSTQHLHDCDNAEFGVAAMCVVCLFCFECVTQWA